MVIIRESDHGIGMIIQFMDIEWDYPDAHSYSITCDKCGYSGWAPTHHLAEAKCIKHLNVCTPK